MSASYFSFFTVRPALGRFFTADEDVTPIGAPVVVLSHGFWQSEFGGRDVIGQPLQIEQTTFTIIGVAPEGFTGVTEGDPPSRLHPHHHVCRKPGRRRRPYVLHEVQLGLDGD